jgi:hypothetical protein
MIEGPVEVSAKSKSIPNEPTELVLLEDNDTENSELAESIEEFVDVGERISLRDASRVGG